MGRLGGRWGTLGGRLGDPVLQTGGLIKSLRLLYEWLALVCQIDPGGNIREESLSTKAGRRRHLGGKRANKAEAMRPRGSQTEPRESTKGTQAGDGSLW